MFILRPICSILSLCMACYNVLSVGEHIIPPVAFLSSHFTLFYTLSSLASLYMISCPLISTYARGIVSFQVYVHRPGYSSLSRALRGRLVE